jgi:hypothetical protein
LVVVVVAAVATRRRLQPLYLVAAEAAALRALKLFSLRLICLPRKPIRLARRVQRALLLAMAGKAATARSAAAQSKSLDMVVAAGAVGLQGLRLRAAAVRDCQAQVAMQPIMLGQMARPEQRERMAAS